MKAAPVRRVLIVTSSYAPAMIADMQRARQLAWELPALGWEVEVLTPDESFQIPSCLDKDSAGFFNPRTPTTKVPQARSWLFRALGMGSIGWRALRPMRRSGEQLLSRGRFDLVFFSTTQFPLFMLGPAWRSRHGVPFVLDFHDPCYREEPGPPVWARRWSPKHELSRRLAKRIESRAVSAASGLISVSRDYLETLHRRYYRSEPQWLGRDRTATIPFGVLPHDLEEASRGEGGLPEGPDGSLRVVYVGVGGPVMARSFSLFCQVLAHLRESHPPAVAGLRVELYGTMMGWRAGEPTELAEVARAHGVGDLVHEDPRRVSYRQSLRLLLGARGALVLGVDDAGYMPSKLFVYVYSGKPTLAIVRRDGPAYAALRGVEPLGQALWFDPAREIPRAEAASTLAAFLSAVGSGRVTDRRSAVEPFLARTMAQRHAALFAAATGEALDR